MARRDGDSLAAILLTTRLVDSPAPPLGASEFWRLCNAVPDPGRLLGLDRAELDGLLADTGFDAARIHALLDRATVVALALERLETSGITVVSVVDAGYPRVLTDRLGLRAPAVLHVVGDPALMARDLLGIVGASEVGEDTARDAAAAAVRHGWGVVNGGVRGIDRITLTAATEAGGCAVVMLADALARVIEEPDLRRLVAKGQLCLASPFAPTARFTATNAVARAKLLHALARRTLVLPAEPDDDETWAGAIEALELGIPVDVWTGPGAGPGTEKLVDLGGRAITDLDELFTAPPGGDDR